MESKAVMAGGTHGNTNQTEGGNGLEWLALSDMNQEARLLLLKDQESVRSSVGTSRW